MRDFNKFSYKTDANLAALFPFFLFRSHVQCKDKA